MATAISICNQALIQVSGNKITSFNDESTEASIASALYVPMRDAVLEAHAWTFAVKWLDLPKLANPPPSEFANAYQLPSEVLSVLFVGQSYEQPAFWRREGMNILSDNAGTPCRCQVIFIEEDPNKWSALFVQALTARLSAEMAIPLAQSRELAETHFNLYERKVREAVKRDNQQGTSRKIRSSWLTNGRMNGPNVAGPYV